MYIMYIIMYAESKQFEGVKQKILNKKFLKINTQLQIILYLLYLNRN